MSKKFRSISWKILFALISTIIILLFFVLAFNLIVLQKIKDDLIFDQLNEFIMVDSAFTEKDKHLWIAQFSVNYKDNGKAPIISMNKYTKVVYEEIYQKENIFLEISKLIYIDKNQEKGILSRQKAKHYYMVKWNNDKSLATVFISTHKPKRIIGQELVVLIILIILICYIASMYVARIISRPIQKLEIFSNEVAKKNWLAEPPKINNDEIGLLAETLNQMKISLMESEIREHSFLQSTSHDLKTPVMIIKGYAQAILDDVKMEFDKPPAQIIINETQHLERKINQLLHLNTIGNHLKNNSNEIIRVDRIIKSLVNRFKVIKPELKWELTLPELEIDGNTESILIALENLIDNQLRFANTYIRIVLKPEEKKITISNDGPFFTVTDPNTLFDLYQRDKQGHFGLGLSIVKQVIDSHDGSIKAENNKEGVVFTILL